MVTVIQQTKYKIYIVVNILYQCINSTKID